MDDGTESGACVCVPVHVSVCVCVHRTSPMPSELF